MPTRVHSKRQSTAALQDVAVIFAQTSLCVLECGGAPPLFRIG